MFSAINSRFSKEKEQGREKEGEKGRLHSTEETIAFIHSRTIHVRRREAENARAIAYDLFFCFSPSHPLNHLLYSQSPTRRRRRHRRRIFIAAIKAPGRIGGRLPSLYRGLIGSPTLLLPWITSMKNNARVALCVATDETRPLCI